MLVDRTTLRGRRTLILLALLALAALTALAACSAGGEGTPAAEEEHGERIPNDGAAIRILSPADGAAFAQGDEVPLEVQVDGFVLGEDGNHWHIEVDGSTYSMVTGGDTGEIIRGLEPGEHEIEVLLANGEHQDLQDGDAITITVE
jgi:hypothetical protein